MVLEQKKDNKSQLIGPFRVTKTQREEILKLLKEYGVKKFNTPTLSAFILKCIEKATEND